MTAKKEDLIERVQTELGEGVTKKDAERYIHAVMDSILAVAKEHEQVRTSVGTFKWSHKNGRTARNPANGEPVEVAPYSTLAFRPAPAIREQDAPVKKAGKTAAAKPAAKAAPKATVKAAPAKPVAKAPVKKVAGKK